MWSIHKCYFEIRLSYIVYIYNSTNNNAVVNLDKNKYEFSVLYYIDDNIIGKNTKIAADKLIYFVKHNIKFRILAVINLIFVLLNYKFVKKNVCV